MEVYTKQFLGLKWGLMVVVLFAFVQQGQCQGDVPELVTDRPDQTDAATLVPRKTIQLETGLYFQEDEERGAEQKIRGYPSALIRLGVLDWLELRVQSALRDSVIESRRRFRSSGFAPVSVGAKVALWEEKGWRPQATIMTMVTLPVGSRQFRPENPEPNIRLLLNNSLTENLGLGYNITYGWVGGDPVKGYAVSFSYDLSDRFTVFGEVFGDKQVGEKAEHSADAGLMFLLLPNLQLDAGVGRALNDAAPDYFVTTGLSLRLPR